MITFPPPCDMTRVYYGDTWQKHCERDGYLANGNEPGLDIISRPQINIPLIAVLGGTITRDKDIGYNMGFGTYCEIDHGVQADGRHYKTLHAHMMSNMVKVGQKVKAGAVVGYMGTTGNSTCIHDHFILWVDGENVDPPP